LITGYLVQDKRKVKENRTLCGKVQSPVFAARVRLALRLAAAVPA